MRAETAYTVQQQPLPFIPAWFDHADVDLRAFRVYCHICSIAWRSHVFYESLSRTAAACSMSPAAVATAIRALENAGLLEPGPGNSRGGPTWRVCTPSSDAPTAIPKVPRMVPQDENAFKEDAHVRAGAHALDGRDSQRDRQRVTEQRVTEQSTDEITGEKRNGETETESLGEDASPPPVLTSPPSVPESIHGRRDRAAAMVVALASAIYPDGTYRVTPGLLAHLSTLLKSYKPLDLAHALCASLRDEWYRNKPLDRFLTRSKPRKGGGMTCDHFERLLGMRPHIANRAAQVLKFYGLHDDLIAHRRATVESEL